MTQESNGPTKEDTQVVLDEIAWCLARYFEHTPESAAETVRTYYGRWQSLHDDYFYHREGPWWMAARIHFISDLAGKQDNFDDWRMAKGLTGPPAEAQEHFWRDVLGVKDWPPKMPDFLRPPAPIEDSKTWLSSFWAYLRARFSKNRA
jgi:hypothetical protein